MGKRGSPAVIGAFVLGAIGLAVLGLIWFGSGRLLRETHEFVLFFRSVNGLDQGAPVKFRGVPIGIVSAIRLELGVRLSDPRIPVLIEVDGHKIRELGASWDLPEGPTDMQRLVDLGLRAQLQLQSVVTGVIFIGLDILPGTPADFVLPPGSPYAEIPTLPTTLEQAQTKIQDILDRLSRVDFEALGKTLNSAIDGVSQLVNSDETKETIAAARDTLVEVRDLARELKPRIGPLVAHVDQTADELRVTLQQLNTALQSIESVLDPNAPLVYGVSSAVVQLGEAARAVRELADFLDRNPNAIITGREVP